MLVASHDNAMDGSLFVGDCGIMDTLFNKPMSVVPENKAVHWAASWFQLAAMTFVAAQKGWDGVWCSFLVALVGVQWVVHSTQRGPSLVQGWPDCGGVDGEEFGGRFAVLGAIQGFTGSNVHNEMLAFSTLVTRGGLIDNNMHGSYDGLGVWGFGNLTHSDASDQLLLPFAEKPSKVDSRGLVLLHGVKSG
ncbi:hypothetical protein E5D57_000716 [Metarhizium anisopliae]|nr:hypothetical protein E5D57_000716 [Metarhizium anisopliae]